MPSVAIVDDAGVMTGIGTFLRSLLDAFVAHPAAAGWEVHLVVPERDLAGGEVTWPAAIGGRVLVTRIPDGARGDVAGWLETWLAGSGVDVAYFVSPDRLRALHTDVPVVATFHDFNYRRFVTLPRPLRARLETELPRWVGAAAVCVVSSHFIAGELTSYFPAAGSRLRVVRLGIPPPAAPGGGALAGLPDRFLLTVGWLAAHKNQAPVFEALAVLRKRGQALPLVCVGPNSGQLEGAGAAQDSYVRELLDIAGRLGLEAGRDFIGAGPVSDAELAALYGRATALVVPSLYEAGSFPLREAARAGCPVLCSEVPALVEDSELLGGAALLFDPDDPGSVADAAQRLLAQPGDAARRVARARELAATAFDWRRTAAGYLAAFEAARRAA